MPRSAVLEMPAIWRTEGSASESWIGSTWRWIPMRKLVQIRGLEGGRPFFEADSTDGRCVPWRGRVSNLDPAPELLERSTDVVQFDANAQAARHRTYLGRTDRPLPCGHIGDDTRPGGAGPGRQTSAAPNHIASGLAQPPYLRFFDDVDQSERSHSQVVTTLFSRDTLDAERGGSAWASRAVTASTTERSSDRDSRSGSGMEIAGSTGATSNRTDERTTTTSVMADPPAKPPDEEPEPESDANGQDAETSRWVTATSQARDTAKWTATALASVGGVIFGAGPIIADVEQDVSDWSVLRIFLVLASAMVGVYGLLKLVGALVRVQLPIEISLARLPPSLERRIEDDPENFLPAGCTSVAQFRRRLRSYRRASVQLSNDALTAEGAEKAEIEAAAAAMKHNADTYERVRRELLAETAYLETVKAVDGLSRPAAKGALLAVFGAVSYLLLVSGPADEDGSAKAGDANTPSIALLRTTDPAGEFWTLLELQACEIEDGEVPVLLSGGDGTSDNPWQLQSIGSPDGCPSIVFSATTDVAQIVQLKPREVKVTVEVDE